MKTIVTATALVFMFSAPALAYVGPGAGLSLLGALWGLIAAVGLALAFVLAWPVRKMLRKRRERQAPNSGAGASDRQAPPSEAQTGGQS